MYFDITDLKLCVNVANAGSITHGAKLTYLTLQSASERIRGLENELNVDIFVRSVKGVSLSNAGHTFIEHAKTILQQIEIIDAEVKEGKKLNTVPSTTPIIKPLRLSVTLTQSPLLQGLLVRKHQ